MGVLCCVVLCCVGRRWNTLLCLYLYYIPKSGEMPANTYSPNYPLRFIVLKLG
ncbi:hypothetical protein Hanom_Chr16g01437041 [Helianthus anomalus]